MEDRRNLMKNNYLLAFPILTATLCAQNLQMTSEAITVLTASASNGTGPAVINQQPVGLTTVGVVSANAFAPTGLAASATAHWVAVLGRWEQHQTAEVFAAGSSAQLGPMEMRAAVWQGGQSVPVKYEIVVASTATAGSTSTVMIDIDDDGIVDHIGAGTFVGTRTLGATPLVFRVATNVASTPVAGTTLGSATLDVRIEVEPDFGIAIDAAGGACGQVMGLPTLYPDYRASTPLTPQAPGVRLQLAGGIYPSIPIQVIGWGQSLLPIPGLPAACTLIPTPDIMLIQADLTIPLPQSVRPVTFYAQGFSFGQQPLVTGELLVHGGFQITAL